MSNFIIDSLFNHALVPIIIGNARRSKSNKSFYEKLAKKS
jgi:hypothetical protein